MGVDETQADGRSIDEIMSGGEPSIEEKRRAKKLAWANGDQPRETTHDVLHGDARRLDEIVDDPVHLIVTSPPYFNLVDYEDSDQGDSQLGHREDYESFLDDLDQVWRACYDVLAPGGRMCVVVGDVCLSRRDVGRHHVLPLHADIATRCREIGFDYLTPILWSKIANVTTEVDGPARFLGKPYEPNGIIKNDVEYILFLRKSGGYRQPSKVQRALSLLEPEEHRKWYRSVWTDIGGESRTRGHPAPFPEELAYRLIKMFSFVGDTVLDPFWGTGTTTAAAIKTVRSSIGIEIEPEYIQTGKKRLSQTEALTPARIHFPSPT
jgi:site-specific DNA-methyltransferase (adenine-specific)